VEDVQRRAKFLWRLRHNTGPTDFAVNRVEMCEYCCFAATKSTFNLIGCILVK
jgi:hypothetical protein